MRAPLPSPDKRPTDRHGEQGFALYLSIGFIVLISVLAGAVGNRLNMTLVSELRKSGEKQALVQAETALSDGWAYVFAQDGLDPNWLDTAIGDAGLAAQTDRSTCLAGRAESLSDFYISTAQSDDDITRRYFVTKTADNYLIYGCGLNGDTTRVALLEVDASSGYQRIRQRRY